MSDDRPPTLRAAILLAGAIAFAAPAARAETPTATASPAARYEPLGYAPGSGSPEVGASRDVLPIEDRWRIGFPAWQRYPGAGGDQPYERGAWWNPYRNNALKGDEPILGDDIFLDVSAASDTLGEARSTPTARGVSTKRAGGEEFFGSFDQVFVDQTFLGSVEVFKGDAAFKPKDLAVRVTPAVSLNYLQADELGVVNVDPRNGSTRTDWHASLQEAFVEAHLADLSPSYDFATLTLGIQPFTSDFRGFLYSDQNLGVRLSGDFLANRIQANLAWFRQLDKDTNSGLNTLSDRKQDVFIANLFVQDFGFEGYTALFSWHYDRDHGGVDYDEDGFLVRPARVGAVADANGVVHSDLIDVHYLGWGGEGHVGRLNIMHQYYFAVGRESRSEVAGRGEDVQAHFVALEPSVDVDWLRFKASFLYASGDRDPLNGRATGFDAIFENPFFAGAGFSYWNRQQIGLSGTGVNLVNRLGLLPDLRSSKTQGQASFVNPGLLLFGGGVSGKILPTLFFDLDVNYLEFADTSSLEVLEQQNGIDRAIGWDYSLGLQWRPLLTENVVLTTGAGALTPVGGFEEIYKSTTLYSGFVSLTLVY